MHASRSKLHHAFVGRVYLTFQELSGSQNAKNSLNKLLPVFLPKLYVMCNSGQQV